MTALVLLGASCKLGVKGIIDERRPEVQANLDRAKKNGAFLAAVPGATGRGKVTVTKTTTGGYANADESQLRSDLADAAKAGIQKHLPSAKRIN